ncbi:MAG TPA: magnesium/cobalt transporter CorA [Anaerolineaceae bacterium]|nr:magnesium/cobalt transporter CorA [Anaerolineaceae bacterium]HPC06937.1 magnesium/cobalt transporter CorA [Anaerolineaceae bacterium]
MIHSLYFSESGQIQQLHDQPSIRTAFSGKKGLLWINISNPQADEIQDILSNLFNFHPLSIEDCQSVGYQPPKVDDFGDYIFLIMHTVHPGEDFREMETSELNIYLGENFLVTVHQEENLTAINSLIQRIHRDNRVYQFGSDFLCHALLDTVVDEYFPILDEMELEIDQLEDNVLETPKPETLERILALKHGVMALRRIIAPQREVINKLSRDEFPQIDKQSQIYFRDIYDHLVRIQDMSETIRDLVSSALEIYLSSTSLKLNNVMKALTIVSTIFLPITFLAGVYGMNFRFMPELTWKFGYPMVWIISLLIIAVMLLFFRKRGWF